MKTLLTILFLLVVSYVSAQCNDERPIAKIFILSGQSNAVGAETSPSVPDSLLGPLDSCLIFNYITDRWERLEHGVNNFGVASTTPKHGIELALMHQIKKTENDSVFLIKYALSNTSISNMPGATGNNRDWNANSELELYWFLMQYIKSAIQSVEMLGYKPQVEYMIWYQGERDSDSLIRANPYYQNTLDMFNKLRNENIAGFDTLQILMIKIHNVNATNMVYDVNVRASQIQLDNDYTWIKLMDVDDLDPGALHLTSRGYNKAGYRAAKQIGY